VAVLGLVFTGHGGYASRADFTAGFVPAMWLAAGLAAAGVLAAVSLPRGAGRRRARGPRALTDPLAQCDNDARDAVSAGAAG
jgi:hypothetical protein